MWTRKELKDKAKVSFRANYWKAVFVALIVVIISLWASGSPSSFTASVPTVGTAPTITDYSSDDVNVSVSDGKITVDVDGENGDKIHVDLDPEDAEELGGIIDEITHDGSDFSPIDVTTPGLALVGLSIGMILLVIIAIALAVYVFVFNPLEIGCRRFFIRNLNQRAEVKEVAYAYDNNYLESVKTLFLRNLFIFLWSLLLIIPGIYKSYEYRMIPYLMAENPTMTKDLAFAESKRMMDGHKWNTFVLDLSFLGWHILSTFTLGILGVFYVCPYQEQTNAALYEKLRYGLPAPDQVTQPAQPWPTAPVAGTQVQSVQSAPVPPYSSAYAQPAPTTSVAVAPVATVPAATAPAAEAPIAETPTAETPIATAPVEQEPAAISQEATYPYITPASQPPVPPFAAVGYEPEADDEEFSEDVADAESADAPMVQDGEGISAEPESTDSPEA